MRIREHTPSWFWLLAASIAWLGSPGELPAAELTAAVELFRTGQYDACAQLAHEAIEAGEFSETWRLLRVQALMQRGEYLTARAVLDQALQRFSSSARLRWLGATVCRFGGDDKRAEQLLDEIDQLVSKAAWQYSDPPSRVTLGRFYLSRGIDAKQVLQATYSVVKKFEPQYAEAYLAAGQLALEKHDYALAAEELQKALQLDATDPDIHYELARAFDPSDSEQASEHLQAALARNPNHINSLLMMVDSQIDAEQYAEARRLLDKVLEVNPWEPRAWAYRAVLAHLHNDQRGEILSRVVALATWRRNPAVDYLIGLKLSQKYRFREGAAYQRTALTLDPHYQPAILQLSQDLLRLGEEEEGWQLAEQVSDRDGYQVVAHNLATLRDHLQNFQTLTGDGFVVRMDPREAAIYGDQVLELLQRARQTLCAKYEVTLERPILVEIFPEQQDFAIRTFGLPGGDGFLGVCFGNVITANSPASQGDNPANWQSVLWHEFCHVVTLNKTKNAMPRWLSEGISVYEERQANSTWGQWLTPHNRQMLLGKELTPVSQLSGAFLNPASPAHLQFAYYESSLVVEFLVQRYGFEMLLRVLTDLGAGMPINESLARYAGSIDHLDREFADYARNFARQLGPDADWSQPDLGERPGLTELADFIQSHPHNYSGLKAYAQALIDQQQWSQAKSVLEQLARLVPDDRSPDSAHALLAVVQRQVGDVAGERAALQAWARLSADGVTPHLRLADLAAAESDWRSVREHAATLLAVNPLLPAVQRHMARAAEQTEDDPAAIRALQALLAISSFDQVDAHYRLGCLLQRTGDLAAAKRHILQALEEAPRFRDGHRKLLELLSALEPLAPAKSPSETSP